MLNKAIAYRYKYVKAAIEKEYYDGENADDLWIKAMRLGILLDNQTHEDFDEKIACLLGRLPDIDICEETDSTTPCSLTVSFTADTDDSGNQCSTMTITLN